MGIRMITSLNMYAENMKMTARWQERQVTGDYDPDEPTFVDHSFQNKIEEDDPRPERSEQMEMDIEIKLNAGKKLSAEEMLYLKAYAPDTYQKAQTILQERTAYEKALESCQTKDEVEQLKSRYASAAVERIRAIRKTPGLSSRNRRELLKMEHIRAAALDDSMHEFIKSQEYEMLPEGTKTQEEGNMKENGKAGPGFIMKSLQEKSDRLIKAAEEAEVYEAAEKDMKQEKKETTKEVLEDDAEEEGSIMRAILDEEARWSKEDEENAASGNAPAEETFTSSQINQAKAAYFDAQVYTIYEGAARIDIKK